MKSAALSSIACTLLALCQVACDSGGDDSGEPGGSSGGGSGTTPVKLCGEGNVGLMGDALTAEGGCVPGSVVASGTLHGKYQGARLCVDNREYMLQVNEWNSEATQSITYGAGSFFEVTEQEASAATSGGPAGYPSMFIGANSSNRTSFSNLPKPVSSISMVPTTFTWNDGGTLGDQSTNVYNVAYDVWFSTGPEGDPEDSSPSGGFLMVWLHDPPTAEPIGGSPEYSGVTIPGVSGTWDVWIGSNNGVPVISYVRTETTLSMSFDLNSFIRDAVDSRPNTILDTWYLTNVFAGYEIWSGGVGLDTTGFCAVVE